MPRLGDPDSKGLGRKAGPAGKATEDSGAAGSPVLLRSVCFPGTVHCANPPEPPAQPHLSAKEDSPWWVKKEWKVLWRLSLGNGIDFIFSL